MVQCIALRSLYLHLLRFAVNIFALRFDLTVFAHHCACDLVGPNVAWPSSPGVEFLRENAIT